MAVVIVSGDKDLMQLVSGNVVMIDTMKDKIYDVAAVTERFGVGPEKVVEILGLMGTPQTTSPASGDRTEGALRLDRAVWEASGRSWTTRKRSTIWKIREAIPANADQARLSRELAQIRTDAAFAYDMEARRRREPDRELLISLFREFEFRLSSRSSRATGKRPSGTTASSGRRRNWRRLRPGWARSGNFPSNRSSPLRRRCGPPSSVWPFLPYRARGFISRSPMKKETRSFPSGRSHGPRPFLTDPGVRKHGHDLKTAIIVLCRKRCPPPGPRLRHDGRLLPPQSGKTQF